jgi:hypothetical protein
MWHTNAYKKGDMKDAEKKCIDVECKISEIIL